MTALTAQDIYQSNLDAVTQCLVTGDLTDVAAHLAVPGRMIIDDAEVHIDQLEDLLLMLEEQREGLLRLGTTEYHRICTQAEFTNPMGTAIAGKHRTYVLRGATYLVAPYPCEQWLALQGGCWRGHTLKCNVRNRDYSIVGPKTAARLRAGQAEATKMQKESRDAKD